MNNDRKITNIRWDRGLALVYLRKKDDQSQAYPVSFSGFIYSFTTKKYFLISMNYSVPVRDRTVREIN